MLSLDRKILERDSAVQKRLVALGEAVAKLPLNPPLGKEGEAIPPAADGVTPFVKGELTVLVPGEKDEIVRLSPHLTAYSFGGGKAVQLWKMWRQAKSLILNSSSLTPTTPQPLLGKEGGRTYDLITVQDISYLALLAYLLARRFRIPLEVQVHGLERFFGVRKWLAGFVFRRADRVRVVSERLKRELLSRFSIPDSRIYTLPVYTQKGEKGETGERGKGREKQFFTFLTVGRLVPVKNIGMQIRAFARLVKEMPHIRLRIVGDGPERSTIQFLISNFQLKDKVVLEGEQKDVGRFYEEADTFLLTSDSEGWGLAALEAAAYKLPIIMTDVGLAGEFINNNESGLVIPVGNEEQLNGAMKEVLEHPELRARLGESAFKAFKSLPNAETRIQKQVEAWRGLQ